MTTSNAALKQDSFSYDESEAPDAFERLIDAFPQHQETIQSCMWMGRDTAPDGSSVHHFKHIETRNRFTFRPSPDGGIGGTVVGTTETGEESADGDAVLSLIDKL